MLFSQTDSQTDDCQAKLAVTESTCQYILLWCVCVCKSILNVCYLSTLL